MMTYTAPLRDMRFVLHELFDVPAKLTALPGMEDASADVMDAVLAALGERRRELLPTLVRDGRIAPGDLLLMSGFGAGMTTKLVANFLVIANTLAVGEAMAMGERTPVAVNHAAASARLAVGEALTNLAAAQVGDLGRVNLSANWMAAGADNSAPAENPMMPILLGSIFHSTACARTRRIAR